MLCPDRLIELLYDNLDKNIEKFTKRNTAINMQTESCKTLLFHICNHGGEKPAVYKS